MCPWYSEAEIMSRWLKRPVSTAKRVVLVTQHGLNFYIYSLMKSQLSIRKDRTETFISCSKDTFELEFLRREMEFGLIGKHMNSMCF